MRFSIIFYHWDLSGSGAVVTDRATAERRTICQLQD
jgi:hypothetical protein